MLTNAMGVTQGYIEEETTRLRKKLKQRYNQYYKHRSPVNLKDKTVIIVDDGIATGNTLLATVEQVNKQNPKKIVVAIPVAPSSSIGKFKNNPNVDETICLLVPYNFQAVGQFYKNFEQVSDQEAIALLEGSTDYVKRR
jgi:predicted phosphoribosyltransferase